MSRALRVQGENRNSYSFLVGKPEGIRSLICDSCRWEDNIKMDGREINGCGMDWIYLAHDRDQWRALVNIVMNLQVQ
jgi:hypothetical protein